MQTRPPGKTKGRELAERVAEAGAGSVPVVGPAFAVALVTALNWKLNQRRDDFLEDLAEAVERIGERVDGLDIDSMVANPLFVDAVVSAVRTVEHTHQEEKLTALRNAVLNSALSDAPDADTQALFLGLVDRFTASHLRLLTLWDDPPAWFARLGADLRAEHNGGRQDADVEAGLPEMRGRQGFYLRVAADLTAAGMMNAGLTGMVSGSSLLDRLTADFGRKFVEFISPPRLAPAAELVTLAKTSPAPRNAMPLPAPSRPRPIKIRICGRRTRNRLALIMMPAVGVSSLLRAGQCRRAARPWFR